MSNEFKIELGSTEGAYLVSAYLWTIPLLLPIEWGLLGSDSLMHALLLWAESNL